MRAGKILFGGSRALTKENPDEGDDAGVQEQAIGDGGYPIALVTTTASGN